jgi:tetratricopeptide (TPR) repeat protein
VNGVVPGLVETAMRLHVAGALDEACAAYERILDAAPRHFDALHLLGVARRQQGRREEGVVLIRRALAVHAASPEAHFNLGIGLQELGDLAGAAEAYGRAVELMPTLAAAHYNLGVIHQARGAHEAAAGCYRAAIALAPNQAEAHLNLGNALRALGRMDEAAGAYLACVALLPSHAGALAALGNTLASLARHDEALVALERAVALAPDHVDPRNDLGLVLLALGRAADAHVALEAAAAMAPGRADVQTNLGSALKELGRLAEAEAAQRRAVSASPGWAPGWSNLGNVLKEQLRLPEAVEAYDQAVALDPDFAEARFNRAVAHLLVGDLVRGWADYEARWGTPAFAPFRRDFPAPRWTGGEPLAGRGVLLHAEQGLGDTLQFLRFVPRVAARGARVILEVQPPLAPFVRAQDWPVEVRARGEDLPPFDFHCPLMSLPLAFGAMAEDGADAPYLTADEAGAEAWRARLGGDRRLRVGIVWAGNPEHRKDAQRSVPLALFEPLIARPGIRWVALQKDLRPGDAAWLDAWGLPAPGRALGDFAGTAALVAALDLVVTVDTAIAHLAGALGKPVWVLNAHVPDWRWGLVGARCGWYPSARIFRQPLRGDWPAVIAEVGDALDALDGSARA